MSRQERRRAERQQRRRNQPSPAAGPRPAVGTQGAGPDVLQSVLKELDRQNGPTQSTSGGPTGDPAGGPSPAMSKRRPPGPASGWRSGAVVPSGATVTAASLSTTSVGCNAVAEADPQALGLTYTFDAPEKGEPYPMTIGFEGRRTDVTGRPGPQDSFSVAETIAVLPGSGNVSISKRLENIATGEWAVTAGPVLDREAPVDRPVPARTTAIGNTGFAPLIRVRAPGVRIGAWPSLVGTGAVVALTVQGLLAARAALPVASVLLLSLLACVIGLAGARLYYMAEHPHRLRGLMNMTSGMCIQGFVLAAIGTVIVGALLVGVPMGRLLDVTAPGLLFGMAIGRLGCFFGGCCAGRPTASRWGLWSSDRRLGIRRIPTQLFESATALVIGVVALLVMVTTTPEPGGLVFAGGIATYTFGRQLLFPLRDLPRNTTYGRALTMAASGLVLAAAVTTAVLA